MGQVKANTDSGIFTAIQFAAKTALDQYAELTPPIRALYKDRRDAFVGALHKLGWDVPTPAATFYVWIPCPAGYSSTQLCARLLDEADVVTTPGLGFGRSADGYIRAALTVETPRLARSRRSHRQAQPVIAVWAEAVMGTLALVGLGSNLGDRRATSILRPQL